MTKGDPRIRVDADFLFEVDPKSQVFDVVRETVNDAVEDEYADLIAVDDFRSVLRTNHIDLDPAGKWHVDATIAAHDSEMHVDLLIPADGDAEDRLMSYIDDECADRFPVDVDRVRYKKIRIAPGGWFIDAVIEGE